VLENETVRRATVYLDALNCHWSRSARPSKYQAQALAIRQ
jgi:hypothetical protein